MNLAILEGNLGDKPEVKTTKSGLHVCNFSVATTTGSGDMERTWWIKCTAWNDLAKSLESMDKGSRLHIMGSIQVNSWEDSAGQNRKDTFVQVNRLYEIPKRADREKTSDAPAPKAAIGGPPVAKKPLPPTASNKWPYQQNGMEWPKPDADGWSTAQTPNGWRGVEWTNPDNPDDGGQIYHEKDGDWIPTGKIEPVPF